MIDAAAVFQYMLAGVNFVVTPVFREDIAIAYNRRKVLWSPGCGSLTEIARAEELGCEVSYPYQKLLSMKMEMNTVSLSCKFMVV